MASEITPEMVEAACLKAYDDYGGMLAEARRDYDLPNGVSAWREVEEMRRSIRAALTAALAVREQTHMWVPRKPSDSLLWSMALRYDHGLGAPGYYDTFGAGEHEKRIKATLTTMRQLHEEVVGTGFHRLSDTGGENNG